ncbi:MAG TPA: DUF1937 family protein [Pirellulaceae bacterium]|nr:DUF1937 family protein [Pirellulaceae bacterium]
MIYLASPYWHSDPAVRNQRFRAACRATAEMIRQGTTVFSPVVYGHALVGEGLAGIDILAASRIGKFANCMSPVEPSKKTLNRKVAIRPVKSHVCVAFRPAASDITDKKRCGVEFAILRRYRTYLFNRLAC